MPLKNQNPKGKRLADFGSSRLPGIVTHEREVETIRLVIFINFSTSL